LNFGSGWKEDVQQHAQFQPVPELLLKEHKQLLLPFTVHEVQPPTPSTPVETYVLVWGNIAPG
jgi:hypothetical protein